MNTEVTLHLDTDTAIAVLHGLDHYAMSAISPADRDKRQALASEFRTAYIMAGCERLPEPEAFFDDSVAESSSTLDDPHVRGVLASMLMIAAWALFIACVSSALYMTVSPNSENVLMGIEK
ncbi:hypothetical protein [Gallaecimonas pentaromativorans]|uniref:Uncharacterized protein n=1 Tax=Gallaecimonas pentaromativorans TaxID=584787 RepID=A0A3N1PSS5_9GAMM|nr:hypothetical protein [Gallaecimonas pentaromativorans]ROQ27586.1 hypothetical protein EDC28_104237 [Gallaecimonas pentaromativorans]